VPCSSPHSLFTSCHTLKDMNLRPRPSSWQSPSNRSLLSLSSARFSSMVFRSPSSPSAGAFTLYPVPGLDMVGLPIGPLSLDGYPKPRISSSIAMPQTSTIAWRGATPRLLQPSTRRMTRHCLRARQLRRSRSLMRMRLVARHLRWARV